MKVIRTRDVKLPVRAFDTTAGIDFFVPTNIQVDEMKGKNQALSDTHADRVASHKALVEAYRKLNNNIKENNYPDLFEYDKNTGVVTRINLQPGDNVLIPTGVRANVPDGYALVARNKSGVASKLGLTVMADVVDSDYTGEIHMSMCNVTNRQCSVEAGQKLAQFLLIKISTEMVEEVCDESVLYADKKTERGSGGFGSTGSK